MKSIGFSGYGSSTLARKTWAGIGLRCEWNNVNGDRIP
jgi:hypothetical protein